MIKGMVGGMENQVGAFSECIDDRLAGYNAESLGRDRFGKYDAVALFDIPSYNGRNLPKIRISPLGKLLQSAPAQISGIDINMKNNLVHMRLPERIK